MQLKRVIPAALALAAVLIIWLAAGRHIVTALDAVHTTAVSSSPQKTLLLEDNRFLNLAGRMSLEAGPRFNPQTDAQGRAILSLEGGRTFVLGTMSDGSRITPEPGDTVQFETRQSMLPWPTLFDFNFMTGHSPSKRRNKYYRLTWTKPHGASLEMVWRYEQWFYDENGWGDDMVDHDAGLTRFQISGVN